MQYSTPLSETQSATPERGCADVAVFGEQIADHSHGIRPGREHSRAFSRVIPPIANQRPRSQRPQPAQSRQADYGIGILLDTVPKMGPSAGNPRAPPRRRATALRCGWRNRRASRPQNAANGRWAGDRPAPDAPGFTSRANRPGHLRQTSRRHVWQISAMYSSVSKTCTRARTPCAGIAESGAAFQNLTGGGTTSDSSSGGGLGVKNRVEARQHRASSNFGFFPRRAYRITPSGPIRYTVR